MCTNVLYTLSKILAWRRSFNSFHSPILDSFFGVRAPFLWNCSALTWVWLYLFLYIQYMRGFFPSQCQNVTITLALDILCYIYFCYYETNFVFFFTLPLLSFHLLPPTRLYLNRNLSLPLILAWHCWWRWNENHLLSCHVGENLDIFGFIVRLCLSQP